MMKNIPFTKMVAAGNDFIVVEKAGPGGLPALARRICDRTYGAGADGMLVMGPSRKADALMRIFNADGSEAQMCGNGARCAALYIGERVKVKGKRGKIKIETKAGIIEGVVGKNTVSVRLTDPTGIRLDMPLELNGRKMRVNFINTGVPHTIIFSQGLRDLDVAAIGRAVRYHRAFAPNGTNVNFVEVAGSSQLRIRTYERGVEGETLACGTGSAAAALVFAAKSGVRGPVKVHTRGGEVLTVRFERSGERFAGVWLEGLPRIVYTGEYHEM